MVRRPESKRVLITGAAGKTGLALIARLAQLEPPGLEIRALARRADQRSRLERSGAHEVVVADLTDRSGLEAALEAIDTVYHICPNVHPEEVSIGGRLIELALDAGARRFVYHSVLAPRIRAMPHHWAKHQVEKLLTASGLEFTILQPAPYMQNVLAQKANLLERGVYRVPYALSTRFSMADLEDIAEAAAATLRGGDHSGATYELCAGGLLDQHEIAREVGRALGRKVQAETVDRAAWAREARSGGMPEAQIRTLVAMFRYYERTGMTGSAEPLAQLLGRTPRSFADFAERAFESRAGS